MARRYYSSTAVSTSLTAGISSGSASFTVGSTSGFPTSYPFTLILDEGTASEEVVSATNVAGTTVTVTRGVDGTSAVSHLSGASVKHGVSARDFDEPNAHANSGSGAHGLDASLWTGLGAWSSWTPTLSGWTQGNGSVAGSFTQVGNVVCFQLKITGGSTSTGNINSFTLPVTAANTNYSGVVYFKNGGFAYIGAFLASTATTAAVARASTSGGLDTAVTATGVDQSAYISGVFEAA